MTTLRSFLLGILVGILLTLSAGYIRDLSVRVTRIETFLARVTGAA